MQNWKRYGLIYQPDTSKEWQKSHAQMPTIDHLPDESVCRIYFASRNAQNYSSIGVLDFDLDRLEVIDICQDPLIIPGGIGMFDQHGVYPSCVLRRDKKIYLYYIGWNQGVTAPLFYAAIGLAISNDNGKSFQRYSQAPILQRDKNSPCLVTSPFVFKDSSDILRMNFVSGLKWIEEEEKLLSYYHIKSTTSDDGIHWKQNGTIALDFMHPAEKNIARTYIIHDNNYYESWYSYATKNTSYRIGYAKSNDGIEWQRNDHEFNLDVSKSGFDNHMMAYPAITTYKNRKFMFYNGNSFGKEGIGLAFLG